MVTALNKTVVVKPLYRKQSESGLIIPDSATKYKKYDAEVVGEVVAVSKQSDYKDDLAPGEILLFMRHEGKPMSIDNIEHRTVSDKWIMGKLIGQEAEDIKKSHAPMGI